VYARTIRTNEKQEFTMKRKSVFEKFRTFWKYLNKEEKYRLWHVLTAMRGPDSCNAELKEVTVGRIRKELFKEFADELPGIVTSVIPTVDKSYVDEARKQGQEESKHFIRHVEDAVECLGDCVKDVQEFLESLLDLGDTEEDWLT
jgi:hypothetical protein